MADIKNLTVLPRPRSAWQAMDAGFTLARAHYRTLVILWLGISLPVFIVCAILDLWLDMSIGVFLWWWLKPLYELPMFFYLSRAIFSENMSKSSAWSMAVSDVKKLFVTYLTIARFSTARAMTFGVVFLERLPHEQRSSRISTLTTVPTRHYVLMLVCFHIEYILTYAVLTTMGAMFFSEALSGIDWMTVLDTIEDPEFNRWIILSSFVGMIASALVAPFYVAGGFLLYINRRMQLEAWDIEHRFRRIKPRSQLVGVAAVCLAILISTSEPTMADDRTVSIAPPESVSETLADILSDDDFGYTEKRWMPKFDWEEKDDDSDFNLDFLEFLFSGSTTTLASVLKAFLWIAAIVFVAILLFTLRQFRRPKTVLPDIARRGTSFEDAISHPLTQNLPTDIAATAEQLLKKGERREALSVLFRGALRAVMKQYDLTIDRGATESDCRHGVAEVANSQQTSTFTQLLGLWQKEAYANEPQQEQLISTLIDDWRHAFDIRASDDTKPAAQAS